MAERRMFAKSVIDSDKFLDMPLSTQAIYFHLAMRADDDGFITNPKRIQKMIGGSDDDIKLLIAKQYLIPFDSGVIVIKHWKIHNYIQKDRYHPSTALEKNMVGLDSSKTYNLLPMDTGCIQDVSNTDTECVQNGNIGKVRLGKVRLGKVRLGKVRLGKTTTTTTTDTDVVEKDDAVVVVDEAWKKVAELYQDCIHPIPNQVELDDLTDLYDEFGADWMVEAIKEAARNRAGSIKYIYGILRNWKASGVNKPWEQKREQPRERGHASRSDEVLAEAMAMLDEMEAGNIDRF